MRTHLRIQWVVVKLLQDLNNCGYQKKKCHKISYPGICKRQLQCAYCHVMSSCMNVYHILVWFQCHSQSNSSKRQIDLTFIYKYNPFKLLQELLHLLLCCSQVVSMLIQGVPSTHFLNSHMVDFRWDISQQSPNLNLHIKVSLVVRSNQSLATSSIGGTLP